MHLQAPPNLSDDLGALVEAGIDDWGGVSPVTPDHVNPERPWPDLDRLRAATEAAGKVLAPAAHRLPGVRPRPRDLAAPRRADPRCGTPPTPRASPATTRGRRGATSHPPSLVPPPEHRPAPAGRSARCSTGCWPARRSGIDEIVTLLAARGPEVARRGRGGRPAPPGDRRRRGDLRPQPQHQLHERLHVQVQVLRVLEGPAVAQPAGRAVPARPRGDPAPGGRGRRVRRDRGLPPGRHPPRLRRRLLPRASCGP